MSKRTDVLQAVKDLIQNALPGVKVKGMSTDDAKPDTVDPTGMVIVRSGEPGAPEIDLSPPTYWYEHAIPVELAAYGSPNVRSQDALDVMLTVIGQAIAADRYLGGMCTWLDAEAPTDGEMDLVGAQPLGWAEFTIIAFYSTSNPLG